MKGFARLKKLPSIRSKEKINKLCRGLKECLSVTNSLAHLELYNIPLGAKDALQIAKVN